MRWPIWKHDRKVQLDTHPADGMLTITGYCPVCHGPARVVVPVIPPATTAMTVEHLPDGGHRWLSWAPA